MPPALEKLEMVADLGYSTGHLAPTIGDSAIPAHSAISFVSRIVDYSCKW